MRFLPLAILVLPLAAASVQSSKPEDVGFSTERLQRIHESIQRHIDAGDTTGAVTLVARKGRIAHFETHGTMDLVSKKPMSKDAMFRIASMSKPITGVAIMMLVEEGKLRLTDPVSKYIPEFRGLKVAVVKPAPPNAPADAAKFYTVPPDREITVRDLLSHVSGLVSGPISTAEAAKLPRQPADTLADYIPRLGATPLEFQPGSRWSYSPGAGFDTLGRIVEIISGQTFDKFLQTRIFEPLGMKDITFAPSQPQIARMPTNYRKTDKGLEVVPPPATLATQKYFSGAGGLVSTAEDYIQFGQMLANGGTLNGKRLLSPKTVELMSSVHVPDTLPGRPKGRGFGLSMQVVSDAVASNMRVSDGSYGWDGAFGTHFWVDPKEKMVGILMIQTPGQEISRDFENAVMQAIVE